MSKNKKDPFKARNIKRPWYVPHDAASCVDELSFTGRDEAGRMRWYCAPDPGTRYSQAHMATGRCYAYEVLDMIHNKKSKLNGGELGFIARQIVRCASEGIRDGFLEVISDFVTNGHVDR